MMATITTPAGSSRTTVGLLGVDVTDLCQDGIDGRVIDSRRIDEIERRILQIEANLQTVTDLVQP
jgi:hypothetical protein